MIFSYQVYRKFAGKTTSQEFDAAFVHTGTLVADCLFCGRKHFAAYDGRDYEEGELERLQDLADKKPEKYAGHDVSSLTEGNILGQSFVANCDCGASAAIESIVWSNRHGLVQYLRQRAENELKNAQRITQPAALAADAVTRLGHTESE